jgi:hypothetical protein
MTAYNDLQQKGAHNSYQRKEDIHQQLAFNSAKPFQGGCRALEVDFARHSDITHGRSANYFQVTHDQGGTGTPLAAYLGYLLSFHLAAPMHDPVFVTLCIKSSQGNKKVFPDEFDTYIREWFDASFLLTPGQLMQGNATLGSSVGRSGWPDLCDIKGQFIFCLSGTESWKSLYARTAPKSRLCFADRDITDTTTAVKPSEFDHRIVANMNLFSDDVATWRDFVPQLRQRNVLVRGYVLNSKSLWNKALNASVNILATDEVSDHSWAKVGPNAFKISNI